MPGFGGAVKLTGESEYRNALKKITSNLKEVSAKMKLVVSQFDKNDKSTEALTAKEKVLTKQLEEQKSKLNLLKSEYEDMSSAFDEQTKKHEDLTKEYKNEKSVLDSLEKTLGVSSKEYQDQAKKVNDLSDALYKSSEAQSDNEKSMSDMRVEMTKTETECNKTSKQIDELGESSEDAGEKAEKAGKGGFTVFKGIVADLASSAIKKALEGLKELGQKLVDVGKQSLTEYATYEQVVGGVETMFKESAPIVEKYAQQAYKTAGISANEYMQQVTSFSATLLQGLDGDTRKAAEYADMAIKDMSDNANKFGTDISSIQNAYMSIAKDNFQLLDNLKLGYGGTASEMARLLNDSGVLGDSITATANNVKDIPFSQIIEAIHKVQENIGVTGTTAKEAATTIEGSGKSVQASWKNLLTGIADENANTEKLTLNFTDNLVTYLKNVVPRVKTIVTNLGKTATSVLRQYAPGVAKILEGVVNVVKSLFNFIKNNSKIIISALAGIAGGFTAFKIASLMSTAVTAIKGFVTAVKAGETAVAALNGVLSINPWILLATAIGGVVAALVGLSTASDKEDEAFKRRLEALKEEREKAEEDAAAWDSLMEAQQKTYDKGMTELSYYSSLAEELKKITDENGRVKEGYEKRAEFIVTTLNDALGTEIELIDGEVQKYSEVVEAIDKVLEKKKAEVLLASQEEAYAEAIANKTQATKDYMEAETKLNAKKAEIAVFEERRNEYEQKAYESKSRVTKDFYEMLAKAADGAIDKLKTEEYTLQGTFDARKELYDKYTYQIGVYENNLALAHEERYDEMSSVTWEYYSQFKDEKNAEKKLLADQIKVEESNLKRLKDLKEKNNTDIYDAQIQASELQLAKLKESFTTQYGVTEKALQSESDLWVKANRDRIDILSGGRVEFKAVASNLVQAYVDGIMTGQPTTVEAIRKIATASEAELKLFHDNGLEIGSSYVDGLVKGIRENTYKAVEASKQMGHAATGGLKSSVQVQSPSRITKWIGQMFDAGFITGVEKDKKAVMKSVSQMGDQASASFADSMKAATVGINSKINASSGSTSRARSGNVMTDMIAAFKDALSQMKIELDDREVGQFVEGTVAKAIY